MEARYKAAHPTYELVSIGAARGSHPVCLSAVTVQYMPSTYLYQLAMQGEGLGLQCSLYLIWVIEAGSSHIDRWA